MVDRVARRAHPRIFYHRIIMNEKRWTGWPQGDTSVGAIDVTGYVNEAWWHLTWSLVIHMLEPNS